MRYTQVSDSLAAHKADLKQFWRRVRAKKDKFWLLVVAGESECVPSDPTATSPVVVKALCRGDQFDPNLYQVQSAGRLVTAVHSPLVGTIAHLVRENHSEDDLDTFFDIETFGDICGTTHIFLSGDSALAAGRVAVLFVIDADDRGEPDFSRVISCERLGDHKVVVTQPVEALFAEAINESSSPIVLELRRRVDVLEGAALAEVESRLRERDAFKCEIENRLEEARATGKEPSIVFVGYQPKIDIGGGNRGVKTDFVVTETALRSFVDFEAMSRKAADEGLRLVDFRDARMYEGLGLRKSKGGLADFLAELLPPSDKALAERTAVLVPDGTAFPETLDAFPNEIRHAAKRGRMFVAGALDLFAAQPELLDDLLAQELDRYRPWVPASPGHRELLRTVGDATLVGGTNQQSVVFNAAATKRDGTPRFRTLAAVAADLAKARAKQKAEPHQALSAPTTSKKMEVLNLEEMLVIDPEGEGLLNVDGARSLLDKWTEQVGLFDDDNSYTVQWGGEAIQVTRDFKDIFDCGYNYKDAPRVNGKRPKLNGGPLMRYYITVLKDEIKDATADEEED